MFFGCPKFISAYHVTWVEEELDAKSHRSEMTLLFCTRTFTSTELYSYLLRVQNCTRTFYEYRIEVKRCPFPPDSKPPDPPD